MSLWTSNGGLVMQNGMAMNCDVCPCPPPIGCPPDCSKCSDILTLNLNFTNGVPYDIHADTDLFGFIASADFGDIILTRSLIDPCSWTGLASATDSGGYFNGGFYQAPIEWSLSVTVLCNNGVWALGLSGTAYLTTSGYTNVGTPWSGGPGPYNGQSATRIARQDCPNGILSNGILGSPDAPGTGIPGTFTGTIT